MTTITPGTENDENIIVEMVYDKGGRLTARRNPAGELTTYAYDELDRRVGLTNPLNYIWETTYTDLPGAGQRTTLTNPNGHDTLRTTDWLGRVRSIAYGDPTTTPDVVFGYDGAGNRTRMTEYGGAGFTNPVRETHFAHDAVGHITQVGFDADGIGGADVTVSYSYDVSGLRTSMTLSTGESLGYRYDAKGQLIGMTDFDGEETHFNYDKLGRQVATFRPNGLRSTYKYNRASRLKRLTHAQGGNTLADFRYDVDGRGNRTRATETLAHPAGSGNTLITHVDPLVVYSGSWSDTSTDHTSQSGEAVLSIVFFGKNNVMLTMGEGGNHSRYDVYVDRRLWRTLDGYAPTSGTRQIHIPLDGTGPHLLEIRNRREHGKTCRENTLGYDTGIHTVRFISLMIEGTYTHRQVDYTYDALSRLVSAVDEADSYAYTYDVAGNRLSETHNSATTTYDYNAANQINQKRVNDGSWVTFSYDNNGNLLSDGGKTYTWDRANRMMTQADGTNSYSYAYDGMGNRVQQTVNSVVTDYLLDLQPGLTKVIAQTVGGNTQHIVHTPRGVHAQWDGAAWQHMVQDGLGSVRGVVTQAVAMADVVTYSPYGVPDAGLTLTDFGFTGEYTDPSGELYLRARHYDPSVGVFSVLDPFEGMSGRPMSLNGYSWVEGNPVMNTDPSGKMPCFDGNLCEEIRRNPGNYNILEVLGCLQQTSTPTGVGCGPDATMWFINEIQHQVNHLLENGQLLYGPEALMLFLEAQLGDSSLLDLINTPALNLVLRDNLFRMATYGLAIDYGHINYGALGNQTLPVDCDFTVTICGRCRNSTDLGNLMFGFLLRLAGWQPDILIASLGFNLGDTSFAVDSAGILAGYLFPNILNHTVGGGRDSFCQAIEVVDTMFSWRDHVNPRCSEPNPVEIPTSNYRSSPPYWNRYVSSEFPSYQLGVSFENPARALEAMSRGLIDVPE